MSILLVTTALKKTWKNDKDLLFLGEWCKLYSDKILLKSINHSTIEYHWEDRKKFISDCEYLKDINERLIADISVILKLFLSPSINLTLFRSIYKEISSSLYFPELVLCK